MDKFRSSAGHVIAKLLGVLLMIAAFLKWLTYDYPNVSPWVLPILVPGVLGQVINWVVVVVLATAGLTLWNLGDKKKPPN